MRWFLTGHVYNSCLCPGFTVHLYMFSAAWFSLLISSLSFCINQPARLSPHAGRYDLFASAHLCGKQKESIHSNKQGPPANTSEQVSYYRRSIDACVENTEARLVNELCFSSLSEQPRVHTRVTLQRTGETQGFVSCPRIRDPEQPSKLTV